MSKKHKIKKKISHPASERSSETQTASIPTSRKSGTAGGITLILFDRKTKIFLLILLLTYIILSVSKIHTSSIAHWDILFGIQKPESIITGTSKGIRQDEWMLQSTAVIGQYYSGMPVVNKGLGDGNVPVFMSLPINDFSMILRPNLWPFFVLDIERAFAFSWNFNIFLFLITTFLLSLLLTKNQFWLSVACTFFIFLSGAMQWWSYTLGTHMIYLNGALLSLIYLFYASRAVTILVAGIFFLFSAYGFITVIYPPWQIPLAYLYFFLFAGVVLSKKNLPQIKSNRKFKAFTLAASSLVLLFFIYHYYGLFKDTYELMMNTAYPGKRTATGGDLVEGKLFSEFFGIYLAENRFPKQWWNICEASNFVMFFPVVFYVMIYNRIKSIRPNIILLVLSGYIILLLIWVLLGFPEFLSKLSLLSISPAYRTLPVLGVANCFLLLVFLGSVASSPAGKFSWIEATVFAISVFIMIRLIAANINKATNDFFNSNQVFLISLLFTAVYLLLRYSYNKYLRTVLLLVLLGITIPNAKIHPITKGLSPILDNPIVLSTKEIHAKDKDARWAVFGNQWITNLLKVNGINVFNGVKTVPLLKEMAILDPTGKDNYVYNRYAHIRMLSRKDGMDSVNFTLADTNVDVYDIVIDPCSPHLKELGIKYFIFDTQPGATEIRCMTKLQETGGVLIYERKN